MKTIDTWQPGMPRYSFGWSTDGIHHYSEHDTLESIDVLIATLPDDARYDAHVMHLTIAADDTVSGAAVRYR